jgi:uncharacterized protein
MKRVLLSFLMVVFVHSWASAESSVWKAQKDKSIIYLGGTCHILREADFPLPPEFEKAYLASDVLVFETDLSKFQDPSMQQKLLAKAMYADGSTIDQHLSAQAFGELSKYCEANSIPLQTFMQFKPAMLVTMLTILELSKMGVSQQGVDHFYYERGHKDKKPIVGLETVEEQIEYIVTMADGNENQFVSYSIKDMENIKDKFPELATAWRKGDTGKLDELMITELKTRQPQIYKKLVTDRNKNWLPTIESYRKTPKTRFVLVGVGHLVGPDGILESLKRKGYRVNKL